MVGDDDGEHELLDDKSGDPIAKSTLKEENLTLSKNQLKRNRREEYLKVKKRDRKEKEKIKKKEDRQLKEELQISKEISSSDKNSLAKAVPISLESRAEKKESDIQKFLLKCEMNFSIVIDCNWEKNHSESALKSLSQQLMFCYSCNRHNSNPCRLILSGVGPLIREKLEKIHYNNWVGISTHFTDMLDESDINLNSSSWQIDRNRLVYLTSDAEEVIDELDPGCCYIIGGIVDRNSLKGATLAKAKRLGIRTAQLPIKKHFALSATHVLTVNHVFEILLNVSKTGSWPQAIEMVLPKRKTPSRLDGGSSSEANVPDQVTEVGVDEKLDVSFDGHQIVS